MAKCFIPGPITSKEIETSQLCYNPRETGKTRFDGKINTAGDRSKQCRHFSTRKMTTFLKWNSGFYLPLWCSEHLHSISQLFHSLSGTDGNEVPNSQWLSKRFRHLPQNGSDWFLSVILSFDKANQEIPSTHHFASHKLLNLCTPLFSHSISEAKIPPYY